MTDTEREMTSGASGAAHRSSTDRRANIGEYLLAMSHEIRAPLNAVIGMSGMLLEGELGDKNRQYAKSVHSAGESLAAILNDLLDLSRVTAGRLIVEPIPFDLKSTIEETASVLSPRANDRGLALRVDWRPELPRHVIGDPGRTRQVLGNLIGHAVNATSQGEVIIRVMPDGERDGVPAVRFIVEDTGIGIMPERLAHIFDDYVPVDASPYRSFGVTGLGLRLSADLVRRMGGEIGASSEAGKGSRFWFVLPMPSAEPGQLAPVGQPRRGGRALVVEADASARGRYVDQIEEASWDVEFTDNLGAVIETLRAAASAGDPFDACFISDYAVRPLHIEMAIKVKAQADLAKTALIMVTAVGSPGEGKKLWHAGFAAYLRKSVPHEEMRDTLAALSSIGPEGRGPSLITRHSLAEARNAQAFAPDGIDEMLASLTPAIDPTDEPMRAPPRNDDAPAAKTAEPVDLDGGPTADSGLRSVAGPEAEPVETANPEPPKPLEAIIEPPVVKPVPVTNYLPLFAGAPRLIGRSGSPSSAELIAVLELPAATLVSELGLEPVAIAELAPAPTVAEPTPVEPEPSRPVEPDPRQSTWDRPEEFDSKTVETAPAEGLETPETLASNFAQLDGLQGHDFGAGAADAIVEPVEAVPPGAAVDVAPVIALRADEEFKRAESTDAESVSIDDQEATAGGSESEPPEIGIHLIGPVAEATPAPPVEAEPIAEEVVASPVIISIADPAPRAERSTFAAPVAPTPTPSPEVVQEPEADLVDPATLDVVGAAIVDQLAHGGGFFTQYLVTSFIRETPAAIAELATASNRGDGARIKQALATLKAAAAWVGADRLAATCQRAERAVDHDHLDEGTSLIGSIEQAFVAARDGLDLAAPTGLPADIPAIGGAFLDQVGPDRDGPAKALAIRLIDSFSTDASARILELREAVARGDAEATQRMAQTVKGMCGLISAEPLAKLCALVEADARLKRIGQADRYLDHLDREFERVRQALTTARG